MNIPSAITVALVRSITYECFHCGLLPFVQVYIPLSISLAIASDATPSMGLTTAVWSMIVAGSLGGSHHNIVGPTGDSALRKANSQRIPPLFPPPSPPYLCVHYNRSIRPPATRSPSPVAGRDHDLHVNSSPCIHRRRI